MSDSDINNFNGKENKKGTDDEKSLMKNVILGLIGFVLFVILIVTSIIIIKIYLPDDYSNLSSIVPIIETMITSLLAYLFKRDQEQKKEEETRKTEQKTIQAQKESEENLILYKVKVESCQNFLNILEKIIQDNKIRITKQNDVALEKEELKKLFFAISALRIYLKEEAVLQILEQCTRISEVIKNFNNPNQNEEIIKSAYVDLMEILFEISKIFKQVLQTYTPKSNKEELSVGKQVNTGVDNLIGMLLEEKVEPPKDNKWHVNIGEEKGIKPANQYRCWNDMKKFNFWSAGGGKRYADGVKKLKKDDIIYAYISGKGYVARGKVVSDKAELVGTFFKEDNISKFESLPFKTHWLAKENFPGFDSPDIGEYAVKVAWEFPQGIEFFTDSELKISPLTICAMYGNNSQILENKEKVKWIPSKE